MSLYEYRSLFTHKEKDKLLLLKYCSVHVTLCSLTFSSVETVSLSLEMRLHTCCRERPRNSSPCTTSVKRCSERHKDAKSYHDTFFFFSGLVKLALLKTTPNLRCEHREAYRRMCGPGWEAVCMCAGQRRLWCPDSWWGEAETAGSHSKPDEHPSAGGGWLLAAGPAIMTHI